MKFLVVSLLMLLAAAVHAADTSPTELARQKLAAELKLDIAEIELIASETQTWPDSSLGCGKPAAMAMQVITHGHTFVFKTTQGNYRVNATDKFAVVCGPATRFSNSQWREDRLSPATKKKLDSQIDAARRDLAERLNIQPNLIRTLRFVATEWPDSSMACPVLGETPHIAPIKGYRIALSHQGRIYTYHTDLDRVRACPGIETK